MADPFGSTYSPNSAAVREAKRQAGIASNKELERQDRLEYGRALIDSLFHGGRYSGLAAPKTTPKDKTVEVMGGEFPAGTEMVSAYDPKKTYYDDKGKVWKPTPQGTATRNVTRYRVTPGTPGGARQVPIPNTGVHGSYLGATQAPSNVAQNFPGSQPGAGNWYRDSEGDFRQIEIGRPYYDSEGDLRYDSGTYARSPETLAASQPYTDSDGDIRYRTESYGGTPATRVPYTESETYRTGPTAADQFGKANLFSTQGGSFEGIGEDFYKGYIDSILDYQLPQVAEQFGKAQSQDAFSMARQGIFHSTAHNQRKADRTEENTDQVDSLTNAAEGEGRKLRTSVDDAYNTTLQLLESSEDPTRALNQGLTEVNAVINQQPTLSPLADLFSAGADAAASYARTRQARQIADIYNPRSPNQSSGRTFG